MADAVGIVVGQLFMFALIGVFAYIVIQREFGGGMDGFRQALDEVV